RRAGAKAERIAVAAHVHRGAVAAIESGEPAGGDDGGLGADDDRGAAAEVPGHRAGDLAVRLDQIDHVKVAGAADGLVLVNDGAEGFRNRRAGVEEIDIDAARPVVPRREGLRDMAVAPRPADAPAVHLL